MELISEQLDFGGRVAIVTGGATEIGYATALQLAKLGAAVVIAGRTESALQAAAAAIAERSGAATRSACPPTSRSRTSAWR